jgi:hypothetical protein
LNLGVINPVKVVFIKKYDESNNYYQ